MKITVCNHNNKCAGKVDAFWHVYVFIDCVCGELSIMFCGEAAIEFTSKHVIKIQPTMIQNVMWQNSNIVPEAF